MDIKICTDELTSPYSSDIVICDTKEIAKPGDIRICDDGRTENPCSTADALTISGDEDVSVSDVYTASGGIAPYTYSFSGGSINSDGQITAVSSCTGSGSSAMRTVMVTDSCGSSASLDVRLPSGEWVLVEDVDHVCGGGVPCKTTDDAGWTYPYLYGPCSQPPSPTSYPVCSEIAGNTKIEATWASFLNLAGYSYSGPSTANCGPCSTSGGSETARIISGQRYEWRCP